LAPLQTAVLQSFFARTSRFRLTGGGALVGYYLHHRATDDLDLFAGPDTSVVEGDRVLRSVAADLGATVDVEQDSTDFRRLVVRRGPERVVVDLVVDRVPRIDPDVIVDGVHLDSEREIAANKVCTLLSRMEPRDLFDLRELLARGHFLERAVADARVKDGGAEPATLAWVLSRFRIPASAPVPAGATADELLAFRDVLVDRLTRMALPPA
jgi:predicted nucleotidyltransferase component of viral defense system